MYKITAIRLPVLLLLFERNVDSVALWPQSIVGYGWPGWAERQKQGGGRASEKPCSISARNTTMADI